ncbi:hypothetical protein [Trinickia symbiotica]|uniref:hypothetical protein n=1 Tax=Trinickia symbiotica TaxID=863227 RepID=UPI0015E7BE7C|nr:hypothetical protein [Trinickia symbiotica]
MPLHYAPQRAPVFKDGLDNGALAACLGNHAHHPVPVAHQRTDRWANEALSSSVGIWHCGIRTA